jgi:carbonic anhydrase
MGGVIAFVIVISVISFFVKLAKGHRQQEPTNPIATFIRLLIVGVIVMYAIGASKSKTANQANQLAVQDHAEAITNGQNSTSQQATIATMPASQNYIEYKGQRTTFNIPPPKNTVQHRTGNPFIDQSMQTADKAIADMGKGMIQNAEKVQREGMAKLIRAQNESQYRNNR